MLEFNHEKTFRDRGSGFVEISSYRLWDNKSITRAQRDKNKFSCVFNNLKHNIYVNIN